MMKSTAVLLTALHFGAAYASDYASCILDRMPGSANNAITTAVTQTCLRENPGAYYKVERGSGLGIFGYNDAQACTLKKAKDTIEQRAAMLIAMACRCLYDTPDFKGEMCAYPPVQMSYAPAPAAERPIPFPLPPVVAPAPTITVPTPAPKPVMQIYASPVTRPAKPLRPSLNEIRKTDQEPKPNAQVLDDLNRMADRAIRNYPELGTPAGAEMVERIVARRDELIRSGTYPSIALTQATNDVMLNNLPTTTVDMRPQQKAPVAPAQNAYGGCRWISSKEWTCQ